MTRQEADVVDLEHALLLRCMAALAQSDLDWAAHCEREEEARRIANGPHCPNGHPRTPDNIGEHGKCLVCRAEQNERWMLKRRGLRAIGRAA